MSRPQIHVVKLTKPQRSKLKKIVEKGRDSARKITRARILLYADRGKEGPGWTDLKIAETLGVTARTVGRIRERFVEEGTGGIERRKHRRYKPRKLDGTAEARLIALACGPPPEGHSQWSLRLLADQLVYLDVVDSIGHEAIRRTLKKTNLSLGKKTAGASRRKKTRRSSARWKTS